MELFIVVNILLSVAYGALPISWPDGWGRTGPVPYNMIDAYPACYAQGLCPMFEPGGRLSAFPNSEEKFQMIMHNLFRQFANESLNIKYAKWAWGVSKTGGKTAFCTGCKYCGETHPDKEPLYWFSPANQAARFKQYDENSCDQDWYYEEGNSAHSTCNWVLPEYGGGSNCDLFSGSCSMAMRTFAFCDEQDNCWFDTEGICGANTCVTDGHCDPIFANKYDYQGSGFVEGMNGAATVYSRATDEITYLLPAAAHFDERMRLPSDLRSDDRMFFTLMLEYFDVTHTQMPEACYSLFKGGIHKMNVTVSEVGDYENGYSIDSYSVIFTSVHKPIIWKCTPYAFICKTTLGNFVRLPEDSDYYFGPEWIDWEWSDYDGKKLDCKENHYYYDGSQWVVNGDPQLDRCDIWYYQTDTNTTTCRGCQYLNQLDCLADCIYADFDPDSCDCSSVSGPYYGNEWCDPALSPTPYPTEVSEAPTPSPTPAPVDPTPHPSRSPLSAGVTYAPSSSPTPKPSRSPLGYHQTHAPSPEPTIHSTDSGDSGEDRRSAGGGGTALVVILILIIIAVAIYVYWRKHDKKPLLPRVLSGGVTKIARKRTESSHGSRSSRTASAESRSSHLELPGLKAPKPVKPVKSYSMDVSDDEGDDATADDTTRKKRIKSNSVKKGVPRPKMMGLSLPKIMGRNSGGKHVKSYSMDVSDDETTKFEPPVLPKESNSAKKGLPPPKMEGLSAPNRGKHVKSYSMDADTDDEAYDDAEEAAVEYKSIEEAKKMSGDKVKYLSDEDFMTVFSMNREDFDKLAGWKQKRAKQQKGFF